MGIDSRVEIRINPRLRGVGGEREREEKKGVEERFGDHFGVVNHFKWPCSAVRFVDT